MNEPAPCEGCGTTDRRRTRNRLPDGTRAVLCDDCVHTLQSRQRALGGSR